MTFAGFIEKKFPLSESLDIFTGVYNSQIVGNPQWRSIIGKPKEEEEKMKLMVSYRSSGITFFGVTHGLLNWATKHTHKSTMHQSKRLHLNRLRGRMVKGVGHLDHVLKLRSAEGREFNPRPGQYSRMSFSSNQVTGTVFSSEHAFPSKFWIYLEHCPRGEAIITGHLRLSSMR